jgi:hypothetical protein
LGSVYLPFGKLDELVENPRLLSGIPSGDAPVVAAALVTVPVVAAALVAVPVVTAVLVSVPVVAASLVVAPL